MTNTSKGAAAALATFSMWSLFPLYFHALNDVSPLQIIAHRVVWSCVCVLAWMAIRSQLPSLRAALANRNTLGRLTASAALITVNWIVYVWAVMNGHVVEASLGYFICPLVNVLLGVVVLSESLTATQWTAVALATTGVVYLTIATGSFPWIALSVAVSFAVYGLIRKVVKVDALPGLATETLLLMPFAVAFLLWCEAHGTGALGHKGPAINTLLVGCGPITAIPLFLFAYAARLLPYSTLGLLQYVSPTGQFLCGIFAFHEPFDHVRALGFIAIWAALAIYVGEGWWRTRRAQQRVYA